MGLVVRADPASMCPITSREEFVRVGWACKKLLACNKQSSQGDKVQVIDGVKNVYYHLLDAEGRADLRYQTTLWAVRGSIDGSAVEKELKARQRLNRDLEVLKHLDVWYPSDKLLERFVHRAIGKRRFGAFISMYKDNDRATLQTAVTNAMVTGLYSTIAAGVTSRWSICREMMLPFAAQLNGIEICQSHHKRKDVKTALLAPIDGAIVPIQNPVSRGACFTTLDPYVELWTSKPTRASRLEAKSVWRRGDSTVRNAAWLEVEPAVLGTENPLSFLTDWALELNADGEFSMDERDLRLETGVDGRAVFVEAASDAALKRLELLAKTFPSAVTFTGARNVETTKGFDGFPSHRVERAYSAMLAPLYIHIELTGASGSTFSAHPVAVIRGGDDYHERLAIERRCKLLPAFDDLCNRGRVVMTHKGRQIYTFCGATIPDAKALREAIMGFDGHYADLFHASTWQDLVLETPREKTRELPRAHSEALPTTGISTRTTAAYAEIATYLPKHGGDMLQLETALFHVKREVPRGIGNLTLALSRARIYSTAHNAGAADDVLRPLKLGVVSAANTAHLSLRLAHDKFKTSMPGGTGVLRLLKERILASKNAAIDLSRNPLDANRVRTAVASLEALETQMNTALNHEYSKAPKIRPLENGLLDVAESLVADLKDLLSSVSSIFEPADAFDKWDNELKTHIKKVVANVNMIDGAAKQRRVLLKSADSPDPEISLEASRKLEAHEESFWLTSVNVLKDLKLNDASEKKYTALLDHRKHRLMLETTGYTYPDILHQGYLRTFCGMWYKLIFMLAAALNKAPYGKRFFSERIKNMGGSTTPTSAIKGHIEAYKVYTNLQIGTTIVKIKQPDISRALILLQLDVSPFFPEPMDWFVARAQSLWSFLLLAYNEPINAANMTSMSCVNMAALVTGASHELELIIDVLKPPLKRSGGKFGLWSWRVTSPESFFHHFPLIFAARECVFGDIATTVMENAHKLFKKIDHKAIFQGVSRFAKDTPEVEMLKTAYLISAGRIDTHLADDAIKRHSKHFREGSSERKAAVRRAADAAETLAMVRACRTTGDGCPLSAHRWYQNSWSVVDGVVKWPSEDMEARSPIWRGRDGKATNEDANDAQDADDEDAALLDGPAEQRDNDPPEALTEETQDDENEDDENLALPPLGLNAEQNELIRTELAEDAAIVIEDNI
jgi:hypothetical protein